MLAIEREIRTMNTTMNTAVSSAESSDAGDDDVENMSMNLLEGSDDDGMSGDDDVENKSINLLEGPPDNDDMSDISGMSSETEVDAPSKKGGTSAKAAADRSGGNSSSEVDFMFWDGESPPLYDVRMGFQVPGEARDDAGSGHRGDDAGNLHRGDAAGNGHLIDDAGSGHRGEDAGNLHPGDDAGNGNRGDDAGNGHRGDDAGSGHHGDDAVSGHHGDDAGSGRTSDDDSSHSSQPIVCGNVQDAESVFKFLDQRINIVAREVLPRITKLEKGVGARQSLEKRCPKLNQQVVDLTQLVVDLTNRVSDLEYRLSSLVEPEIPSDAPACICGAKRCGDCGWSRSTHPRWDEWHPHSIQNRNKICLTPPDLRNLAELTASGNLRPNPKKRCPRCMLNG